MIKPVGQSVIEAICVCLSLILILKILFIVFWLTAGSLWVDHQLYQKLVCLAEGRSQILCQERLTKNIKTLHPLGTLTHPQIQKRSNLWKGKIQWSLYGIRKNSRQRLSLP
ncbi:MAG: hypothetical protein OXB86_00065 [Bdellovibrionales bacterium]|nr:hypothetical protein [Bdellovibrionales bacterium]